MFKKTLFVFASLALAVASAATSYNVTFYQPVKINGSELQPGDYKLELKNNTAVIKQGKKIVEAPATVENENQKYKQTVVRLNGDQVDEIRLGGTEMRVVFDKGSSSSK